MICRFAWTGAVASGFLIVLGGATWSSGDAPNTEAIRTMPRERRLALVEKLEEFDKAPRQEQEAIRALDAEILKRPTEEQERYLAVARRYHLALNSLPPDQREQVKNAAEDKRIELLLKLLSAAKSRPPGGPRQAILDIDPADFLTSPPYQLAHEIRFWIGLTSTQQAEIHKLPHPKRVDRLRSMMRKTKDAEPAPDPAVLTRATDRQTRMALVQKKFAAIPKNAAPRVQARFRDAMVLTEMENVQVTPANLDRFESAIPSFLRESLDPLPSDSLRKRLALLYRIAYPTGTEMPKTSSKPEPKSAEEKKSAPQPKAPPSNL